VLAQRVASAAVGIPVIYGLIFIGGLPFTIVVAVALAIAAAEFAHMRLPWLSSATFTAAIGAAVMALLAAPWGLAIIIMLSLAALGAAAGPAFVALRDNDIAANIAWAMGGMVYVGALGSAAVLLRETHDGRDWLYLALFSTFAVDTGAYFVGRRYGCRRMAPRISPNKTWEGFGGGCVAGVAAVFALNYALGIRDAAWAIALLAALLPLAATLGDLAESALKRAAGVKDASELIPGHGGVLDRLDSLLWTVPLVYVFAAWVV
jgi:phosphatidate cytidylyltransferase